jgi:protein phosphatase
MNRKLGSKEPKNRQKLNYAKGPMVQLKTEFFGLSDIGRVRANNEDVFRTVPSAQFYILADGMGGHNAGEIAATEAVDAMCRCIAQAGTLSSVEENCNVLRSGIAVANACVNARAHQDKALKGMGTTLSCFLLCENVLIYAHVGDSRIYRYRQALKQLTEDHSLRHALLTNEEDPSGALPTLLYRNVITRAIGTHPYVLPDIGVIPLQSKDIYMLCSDGLTDCVCDEEIQKILRSSKSLEHIGKELITFALEKGGSDNITALLVKIS